VAERRLVLLKGEHQYVFRVTVGQEARFLEALRQLAQNERLNFDWDDVGFFSRLVEDLAGPSGPPPCCAGWRPPATEELK
jgi:hypothetical protein